MDHQHGHLLRPPWLHLARLIWLVLISTSALMFVAALQPRFDQLLTDPYSMRTGLEALGVTLQQFAVYDLVLNTLFTAAFVGFAVLLFARGSQEWMVLLFSLSIGMLIILILPVTGVLVENNPALQGLQNLLRAVGFSSLAAAMLLFPDGHFAPRWTRLGLLVIVFYSLLWPFYPQLTPIASLDFRVMPNPGSVLVLLLFLAFLAAIQVYRYRYISTATQRQQTRWAVLGIMASLCLLYLVILIGIFWEPLRSSERFFTLYIIVSIPVVLTCMLLFPLTVVIAVLRYRLWDLDIIIRRTLVYSLLSALLGLLYFSGVTVLQSVFLTAFGHASPAAIVISTLAIAALFTPLRNRLQDFIDRRFYRRKYNAERALAEFAAAARSETDLDQLSARLTGAVQETLQPQRVSLWLIKTSREPNNSS